MYGKTGPGEEPLVADIAFEVFGLLVLYQYLLIIKLSVAIPIHLCQGSQSHGDWLPLLQSQAPSNHLLFVHYRRLK